MIEELRAQLISDLETGSDGAVTPTLHKVFGPWPDRPGPPCYVVGIEPGQYVVKGQTFVQYEMLFTVVVLVRKSPTMLTELEGMVEYVLSNTQDWGLRGVDSPTSFTQSGLELLGTTVHLAKQSKL
jgi:hypothetical protein